MRSPDTCEAVWKTWRSLPLSAPANRMATNWTAASTAAAMLTSLAFSPSAVTVLLKSDVGSWPRNCAPLKLCIRSVAPPNVLGSRASRPLSAFNEGSAMLGRAPLAAGAVLSADAALASADGDGATDGATEAAVDGAAALGAAVAEPPQAATKTAPAYPVDSEPIWPWCIILPTVGRPG